MANFHTVPGGRDLNGTELAVDGTSVTIGLYGPKDFGGQDLFVTNAGDDLIIQEAGWSGNSRLYKITVTARARATRTELTDELFANTQSWETWSRFTIRFRFAKGAAHSLIVRPITEDISGAGGLFRSASTELSHVINAGAYRAGSGAPLDFVGAAGQTVHVAFFAAKIGTTERAFILACPPSRRSRKLMVVISHGFGQNHSYYNALGYADPLSPPLVMDVLNRFVLQRWGAQLMAASQDYALLMPVRAKASGAGELGPFISETGMGTQVIGRILALTEGAFGVDEVDVVTFSSGIGDANVFANVGGKGLPLTRGFNQDPARATALSLRFKVRKQYLSGQTGRPTSPGFELLPLPRWSNEPNFDSKLGFDTFNYLHTWCLPHYTLYLGLKT